MINLWQEVIPSENIGGYYTELDNLSVHSEIPINHCYLYMIIRDISTLRIRLRLFLLVQGLLVLKFSINLTEIISEFGFEPSNYIFNLPTIDLSDQCPGTDDSS